MARRKTRYRARRRKTRTKQITRGFAARKTFLGYRKLNGRRSPYVVPVRKAQFFVSTKKFVGSESGVLHRGLRKSHPLSKPSFKKRMVTKRLGNNKLICQNRRLRREVLFANNKTGKVGQKRPIRRNPEIICRR